MGLSQTLWFRVSAHPEEQCQSAHLAQHSLGQRYSPGLAVITFPRSGIALHRFTSGYPREQRPRENQRLQDISAGSTKISMMNETEATATQGCLVLESSGDFR